MYTFFISFNRLNAATFRKLSRNIVYCKKCLFNFLIIYLIHFLCRYLISVKIHQVYVIILQ